MRNILVIGGGASGMAAALFAARAGANVTLLERNEKLGKKVYITGKGRCNLTNDCALDDFLAEVPRNPRFLYSALSFLSPRDTMELMTENGCPVQVQRGQRVFPQSEKASDVTRALTHALDKAGVRIRLNAGIRSMEIRNGRVQSLLLDSGETLGADAVILCTGGYSYPSTGSTGDGYRFAAQAGHTVTPPSPVLVGMETKEDWPRSLQGLSLKNVTLTLSRGKKTLYSNLGEMLFTHFGISGPLVLEGSCHLPDPPEGVSITIDLKPGLTESQLDARLLRDFAAAGKKQLRTELSSLLPARLADQFPALCGLSAALSCSQITQAQRAALVAVLKALPISLRCPRPVEEAVVTRGGVSVREINPGSMASKIIPNLYFAGEIIDVDAHTGGFNLQIAWSTGALAGHSAATEET